MKNVFYGLRYRPLVKRAIEIMRQTQGSNESEYRGACADLYYALRTLQVWESGDSIDDGEIPRMELGEASGGGKWTETGSPNPELRRKESLENSWGQGKGEGTRQFMEKDADFSDKDIRRRRQVGLGCGLHISIFRNPSNIAWNALFVFTGAFAGPEPLGSGAMLCTHVLSVLSGTGLLSSAF